MIAFFGPAQAVAISPFCALEDVTAWAPAHRATASALSADAIWRQMLVAHFRPAFAQLAGLQAAPPPPETLAARLPAEALREVYVSLRKTLASSPFVLEPRSRLQLEIHELLEWDRHKKVFSLHQQAACLAAAVEDAEAVERLRAGMAPAALELVSLQTMMGGGGATRLAQLEEEMRWGESAEAELRQLMDKRLQQRRTWWQRQREHLLQDLEWQ